ncbi:DegT/DnrJ/EryC1/StrS family aminotransferase [Acinetobacter tjernbergiae]|uniref:Uncharacterized protein n=1 Tax=Acinetobacter tjernbergiae DSM 14971 = CIP 107465 TaxID=1120928 RepID=V2UPT4_9GAMM|nr:DegT/DnrJ/EryC1/StrS family aminotransferase [Acinetobacter tjernbergiae]ESK56748.1 hypothetical protein F990_00820 [Acinetobacter tjernbergiae DSM 14971 = CIP 107465]
MNDFIYVTQPYLPDLKDFIPYLEKIWENKILTNGGPLHLELEKQLENYLNVPYVTLFNNGTNALITAIQALNLSEGQVITTPYSFVATAHAILWNNLEPVFVDIEPYSPNINVSEIEAKITDKTVAILAVHCYGIPCNVKEIEVLAEKYNLKVIYDSAHAFGVNINNKSILEFGDLSVVSFHATKVFNTFEGGAVICHTKAMKERLVQLKNFGIVDEDTIYEIGLNGKLSEIHSAMGLLQLKSFPVILSQREKIDSFYRNAINNIKGVQCINRGFVSQDNYSYFPIIVTSEYSLSRDQLFEKLKSKGVIARKYFYPLISDFEIYSKYNSFTPNASDLAKSVLCIPLYPNLEMNICQKIIDIIIEG